MSTFGWQHGAVSQLCVVLSRLGCDRQGVSQLCEVLSKILPWHVANQLYSLTTYIPINRCPSPVLGHHPFLVNIEYIFKYGPVKEKKIHLH